MTNDLRRWIDTVVILREAQNLIESADPRSAVFKKWFHGSKVIDADGAPSMCYHGTNRNFAEYYPFTHFGTLRSAETLLWWKSVRGRQGDYDSPNIRPVYLCIRNPFTYTDYTGPDSSRDVVREMKKRNLLSDDEIAYLRSLKNLHSRERELIDHLATLGFDGLRYRNNSEDKGSWSWVIFRSDQVWPAPLNQPDIKNVQ